MEASWESTAIVLLLDIRECKTCGTQHCAPNPHLMVRQNNPRIARRLTRLTKYDHELHHLNYKTPRQTQRVYTSVDRCQHCFMSNYPDGQLEMFPPPLPPTSTRTSPDDKPQRKYTELTEF